MMWYRDKLIIGHTWTWKLYPSKDGLLATGGVGTTVSIYDVTSKTKVHEFKLDHGACSVSFSPGGSLLAIGEYGESISKISKD